MTEGGKRKAWRCQTKQQMGVSNQSGGSLLMFIQHCKEIASRKSQWCRISCRPLKTRRHHPSTHQSALGGAHLVLQLLLSHVHRHEHSYRAGGRCGNQTPAVWNPFKRDESSTHFISFHLILSHFISFYLAKKNPQTHYSQLINLISEVGEREVDGSKSAHL